VLGGFLKPLNSKGQEHIETLAAPFISRWTTEALMEVERRGLAVDIQSSESEVQKVLTRSNEVLWRSHLMQEPKGLTPHRLGVDALAIFALLNIYLASASVVLVFRRR
jgi:hypothetical protein